MKSKILVVSYSRSGTTREVADSIASALSADPREILDVTPRNGPMGYWRSAFESLARGLPSIRVDFDPAEYEMVIVGTPVWFGSMASPVRSFLFRHGLELPRPAFFCTMARDAYRCLDEMGALCGADDPPVFSARAREVEQGLHARELHEFIRELQRQAALLPAAA